MSYKEKPITQVRFITTKDSLANNQILIPKLRNRNYNADWVFILLCFCFTLFALINFFYKKRVLQLTKAFLDSAYSSSLVKAENVLSKQASLLLSVLFLFSFSLFSYQIIHHYYRNVFSYTGLTFYFLIQLCLLLFYVVKIFSLKFIGFILNTTEEVKEYMFSFFLINQFVGLLLLPFIALANYLPIHNQAVVLLIGLLFIMFFFVYRVFKGFFSLWLVGKFSKSYLFLYLCALEILPLFVIGKFIFDKYQL